jgi:hypothetical protein
MNSIPKIGAIVTIIAIIGAVGAVATLTSIGSVQQAEAVSCSVIIDGNLNQVKRNCSSENSFENGNGLNTNLHFKDRKP